MEDLIFLIVNIEEKMHQISVKNVKEDLHLKLSQWGRENELNIAEIKGEKIFKEWVVLMEKVLDNCREEGGQSD